MEIQLGTTALEILKWVGIVFAAGIIGYFGRYLSMLIIAKIHKRKSEPPSTNEGTANTLTVKAESTEKDKLKLEKKKVKQESKIAKKKKGIQ